MRAKVVSIESGSGYKDCERRVTIRFEGAESWQHQITVRESVLGLPSEMVPVLLDTEMVFAVAVTKETGGLCPSEYLLTAAGMKPSKDAQG